MSKENAINAFSTSTEVANKKILIAPLNWGLGHATRCIPIIQFLQKNNFNPIIASDGDALLFLKNEFPGLKTLELPSYNIQYAKKGFWLKWKLIMSVFSIKKAVQRENKIIADFVQQENILGIISDNRFGVFHDQIPSIYLTHQLQVFSGATTVLSTKIHQKIISKFTSCWVPDFEGIHNLAGALTQRNDIKKSISFIGNLSRLVLEERKKAYEILVLLSGPEPQRTILEKKLLHEFSGYDKKVLFVRGVLNSQPIATENTNIQIVNFLQTKALQNAMNSSKLVLSRSGYSTIMDLAKLKKKAFFIPTPGQSEQKYLATYLKEKRIAPFCQQEQFRIDLISNVDKYTGFIESYPMELNNELLHIFH